MKKELICYPGHFLISTKGNERMEMANQLISIFCEIDDFYKEFDTLTKNKLLTGPQPGKRGLETGLSMSEIMRT